MARQAVARRPQEAQAPPPQAKIISFDKIEKMNTKQQRQNLSENEVGWLENLQPIAPNRLQAVPGPATSLATIAGTTSRLFPANIGGTDYIIAFTAAGAGIAINANTGVQTTFAPAATFSATPDMTTFASQRILIMDSTGGYATWDGTLFVKSGGISPNIHITAGGSGYTSAPAVSFTGGAGNNAGGATATATISGGAVVSITVTNAGTGNAANAAIVVVLTGGGFSVAATATVVVWPQTTGTTIAVFAGRVWWANGRVLNFTGTGATTGQTFDDTASADAAGSFVISDADLVHSINALRALNNFLYIFGDQSIKQIGSITVVSSVTTFTILTLVSDIGTSFMMTIQSYNRLVLFANKQGVYAIFGASVQKISDDLDGIFQLTDFSLAPSSALNDLSNIHCYELLLKYIDPFSTTRTILVIFQQNQWFVASQGNSLLAITSIPLGSTTQVETFGSSGSDITQLLQNVNVAVAIILKTALTFHNEIVLAKRSIRAGVAVTTTQAQSFNLLVESENGSNQYVIAAASVINWIGNAGQLVTWQNNTPQTVTFIGGGFRFPYTDADAYGKVLGATLTGTVLSFAVNAIAIEYIDADAWGLLP